MFDLFGNASIAKTMPLGLPYRGSKRKYADFLICKMLEIKPHATYFYDIFGGGGAMSFAALQKGMTVVYNEKQSGVVEFLKFIFECTRNPKSNFGILPEEYYNFITREEFFRLKTESGTYAEFARICYSFGNDQRSYMFNQELETIKHLAHDIVVFRDRAALISLNKRLNATISISDFPTIFERRLAFCKEIREMAICRDLEQLQQLQQLRPKITFLNLDYSDVKIETPIKDTIVYLDPPYRNTGKYLEEVDFDELDSFFLNLPYVAFMSEYNAPFKSIYEIKTRSAMGNNNNARRVEKLYINNIVK